MTDTDLQSLEEAAYTESYSDGLVDVFIGLSVVWIGVAWQWIDSLAGLAGVFPAVLGPALAPLRRRIVEARAGFVSWSLPRRQWERRQLWALFSLGVAALLVGIGVYVSVADEFDFGSLVAGLPAILLAIPALLLGFASGMRRLLGYGVVLFLAGAATVVADADPGIPLLVGGAVILASGISLFSRFVRANPRVDA